MEVLLYVVLLGLGAVAGAAWARRNGDSAGGRPDAPAALAQDAGAEPASAPQRAAAPPEHPPSTPPPEPASPPPDAPPPPAATGDAPPASDPVRDALAQARALVARLEQEPGSPLPEDIAVHPAFVEAVDRLSAPEITGHALAGIARSSDGALAYAAMAALGRRESVPPAWAERVWRRIEDADDAEQHFLFESLAGMEGRLIGPAIAKTMWVDDDSVRRFLSRRVAAGEPLDDATFEGHVTDDDVQRVRYLLEKEVPPALRDAFAAWSAGKVETQLFSQVGRVWSRPFDDRPISLPGGRAELADRLVAVLGEGRRRSVVLVGEHGTGKTALLRRALDRLPPDVVAFQATAADINAGASYVGELEGRVRRIVDALKNRPVVWVLPGLEEALYAGQYAGNPQGLLDALLPHVASGALTIAAEASPAAWELLLKQRPRVAGAFAAVRVPPLPAEEACTVAEDALERLGIRARPGAIAQAQDLAEQFLPGIAAPGAIMQLVDAAAALVRERGDDTLEVADVLAVLSRSSGLPLAVLDTATPLDLPAVRAFLEQRVLGQPEAVECLIDRVAMVKAGLTDASRPLGVFLFVGPTGTGKTEIAKALAELLFGSPDRLIRLDMSEFQTPDSLERLLSDSSVEPRAAPLVAAVRKAPFSVVLLDEFEKAAAPIWDVFLQVFDDGRLTDLQGRVTDFRRCVIILTSNAGAAIAHGPALGFERRRDGFSPQAVERALATAFRPEFLNRIDRVVVFRPFERSQMRALLEKELGEVVQRRGLRGRPWAIEYDESALTLLIERGFSPDLGARPLKRAVERYLLAPLAKAIVEQRAPSGDQFLFVTARHDRIDVRFVDPDAEPPAPEAPAERTGLDVRDIALHPSADPAVTAFLLQQTARVAAAIRADEAQQRMADALAELGRPGFWQDPARFDVLARINVLDRLEEALRTAENLGRRLARVAGRRGRGAEVAGLLALRLHVLEAAVAGLDEGAADEVVIGIRPAAGASPAATAAFCAALVDMYAAWAARRGMAFERLTGPDPPDGEHLLLAGGLGAGHLLAPEEGMHVEEHDRSEGGGERFTAAVAVAPRPPATHDEQDVAGLARRLLAGREHRAVFVRRYRRTPAPLVRDAVRGYRTGRLDRVLAGDFDLFSA